MPMCADENANKEEEVDTIELDATAKDVDLTRRRIKKIEGFEFLHNFENLCLRWNLISKMENLSSLVKLVELDLYDNQVIGPRYTRVHRIG
uniref:Protein phosphatase 1 regulatory subunit 7 n=1 Tax=Panagrolaimus davidi TaxID=227884 RepID=A0A914PVE9_9BILA